MSDVLTLTIARPVSRARLREYLAAASAVEAEAADSHAVTTDDVIALLSVDVAVKSVTRLEAHKRGEYREQAYEWLETTTGKKRSEIVVMEGVDEILAQEFIARMNAADILAALSWDDCKGFEFGLPVPEWVSKPDFWQATKDPADWVHCKDWLFSRILGLTWEANPQWALAAGNVPFG